MHKILFSKFSNDRAVQFAVRTDIAQDGQGNRLIYKTALTEDGNGHIQNICTIGEKLKQRYDGVLFYNI